MRPSLVLRVTSRWLVPAMLACSLWILVRGHDAPGGGFIGGLVAAATLLLRAFAEGERAAREAMRVRPESLAAIGLLVALASAAAGPLTGGPWMQGLWWELDALGIHVAIGTPLVFDAGVFLVVVGSATTVLLPAIAERE